MWEFFKSILLGIIEGITEWLPISSTGHLIIAESLFPFSDSVSPKFPEMYNYVIQLGAIIAVVVLFWNKLWPFKLPDRGAKILSVDRGIFKKKQWILWFKVLLATVPSALCFFIDDKVDTLMYDKKGAPNHTGVIVIAITLMIYGVFFIAVEKWNEKRKPITKKVDDITYKTALIIGIFQMLAVIPGTSRSGATILGALLIGVARPAAAEFSFFMAVPTMVGVSGLKITKFLLESDFKANEIVILIIGLIVSFIVSMICIKKLMSYVRKRNFSVFGWYRIVLGIVILGYFLLIKPLLIK